MDDEQGQTPRVHIDLRVRGLTSSATLAINERSNALRSRGRDVLKLGLGQSPFPVPEAVVATLRAHAHEKDYLPVRGLPALRDAVAAYHRRRDGLDRGGDDVLVGPGSKELLFLLQLVHDGQLVIPSPAWVSYAPQARIVGRSIRPVQTRADDRWMLRPDALAAACETDPDRPRVVILNYPSNPTGATYDDSELRALADVARACRAIVVSDEIYGELHHAGAHVSIARHYPEGTIVSSGLSKWCGAGGWRLGTFLFPPAMRPLLASMAAVASETFTSTSAPIQHAAVRAFAGGDDIERYLDGSRRVLAAIGRAVAARLVGAGARCHPPEGGFYLFPDFEPLRPRLAARGIRTGAELCEALLADRGVATLPGSEFGRPPEELTCRLAYVDFDGAAALAEATAPGVVVDEAFCVRRAGRVLAAADRIADWLAAADRIADWLAAR